MELEGTFQEWVGRGRPVEPYGTSQSGRGHRRLRLPATGRVRDSPSAEARLTASLDVACSSMVIRDLTLRSAASFGSFHLIRLLYDEYMYYLIEHRVAQAKGETPIAVMGEVRGGVGADRGGGRCLGRGLTCALVLVPAVRQPGHRAESPGHRQG